jgi:hypothetical protein
VNNKIIFLFIAGIIIFVIIIFGINMASRKDGTPPMIYRSGSPVKEEREQPVEKDKASESESAPERDLPIQDKEPLLN